MKKLAVLAMAGFMSVTASAANWVIVSFSPQGTTVYVDADSISDSSGYKGAFARFNLNGYEEIASMNYDSMTAFIQFDCKANPIKSRGLSKLFKNGNQFVYKSNTRSDWSIVYPDTSLEAIAEFVCSSKK